MLHTSIKVIKECWHSRHRLAAISVYNLSFQYNQTKLKLLWTLLNPILQSMTYWLAFHVGMRSDSPIDGISYLCWMLTGLVPWFFLSNVMMGGLNSIISSSGIIKNMKFPISTIPISTVLTEFLAHLCFLAVLIIIHVLSGVKYEISIIYLPYFMLCEFMLMLGYTFLMSSLTVFFRDLQRIISAAVKLLFFLTPVCWNAAGTPMESVQKWNPLAYIIEGFRRSMLYDDVRCFEPWEHLYFWGLTILLMIFGIRIHSKLKPVFVDFL